MILEAKPRAGYEVLDRTRYQHLGRCRQPHNARPDMQPYPTDFFADCFELSGVDPRADFNSERLD